MTDFASSGSGDPFQIVNVASVPLRSPFRYPGGKTWLVPQVRRWLRWRQQQPCPVADLIEPFAGGGIVSLTAVFEELVARATLVELDAEIAAVWQVILGPEGRQLAEELVSFQFSPETVQAALAVGDERLYSRAFAALLRNRISRGGILAPGAGVVKQGENGRGLGSRWYPQTLRRRILAINDHRERIRFVQGDGIEVMKANSARSEVAYFIDPPYPVAGRRLYTHSDIDHEELFAVASAGAGDFLMTYDDSAEIRRLAGRHGFATRLIPMKNTHHARKMELLIGRDLGWVGEPLK